MSATEPQPPTPVLSAESVCPNRPGRGHEWYTSPTGPFCRDCGYRGVDPVMEMKRAVLALCLELPTPVWEDVRDKWNAVAAEIRQLRSALSQDLGDGCMGEPSGLGDGAER